MKKIFTTGDVGKLFNVCHKSVRNWCRDGKMKSYSTPGGRIRITREDLLAFIDEYKMPVPPELISPSKKRVLIVDDEKPILELASRLIHKALIDCELVTAMDGFEAGKKFTEFKPDLVILDIMLPGINGIEVCRTIREADKNVKIICISGYNYEENREKTMKAGADDFMAKPFTVEILIKTVQKLIG